MTMSTLIMWIIDLGKKKRGRENTYTTAMGFQDQKATMSRFQDQKTATSRCED